MKIGIFYIATSVYKNYFDNFKNTMHYLFPEDEKELIILSDGLDEYDNMDINGIKIHVEKLIDLPYPLIHLNKFQIVKTYAERYNIEYVMFVDADTICFEKSKNVWDNMKLAINDNHLLLTRHPHYLYTPNRNFGDPFITSNKNSTAFMNPDLVNKNKCYIMTSFFCGKYDVIKKYADLSYKMIGHDLNYRSFAYYVDEAYMNKIYVKENILEHKNTILLQNYVTINPYIFGNFPERDNGDIYKNNFPEFEDTIILNQKYNVLLKESKKSNNV